MRYQVSKILETFDTPLRTDAGIFMVRDLLGRVRISVSDVLEDDVEPRKALRHLAESLNSVLGAHGYAANEAVLFVDSAMLQDLRDGALEVHPGVYWVDRLVTGRDWWTIGRSRPERSAKRYTLYSVKGGVGRSTTSVVLAWQLGQRGERVLVVDLDLESPGLSSAILDEQMLPRFGVTDHDPFTIHWTSGFAPGGASLRTLEQTTVTQAYVQFIIRFHEFVKGQVVS